MRNCILELVGLTRKGHFFSVDGEKAFRFSQKGAIDFGALLLKEAPDDLSGYRVWSNGKCLHNSLAPLTSD